MMEITDKNKMAMSDRAFMEIIGAYIKHHRLEQNKTQLQLAKEAGINRSTLVAFEKGRSGNLLTLIQLIRSLKLLPIFDVFEIKQRISPIQLAKLEQKTRKRASKKKQPEKTHNG